MSAIFAAVGGDGTRLVVWGIGDTRQEALEDAIGYDGQEDQPGRLVFVKINDGQRANIVAGMVGCEELGSVGLRRIAGAVAS